MCDTLNLTNVDVDFDVDAHVDAHVDVVLH